MFSRRGHRLHRGRLPSPVPVIAADEEEPVPNPYEILGDANVREWWRVKDMAMLSGDSLNVTTLTGIKGNQLTTSGVAAEQPLYVPSAINGKAGARNDSTRRMVNNTLVLPAPGTSPTFLWVVGIAHAWTASARVVDGVAGNLMAVFQTVATPGLGVNNGATVAVGAANSPALDAPFVLTAQFSNAAGNEVRVKSTVTTGSAGNNTATGIRLFRNSAGNYGNFTVCELGYASVLPDFLQALQLSAYFINEYGSIL